MDTKRRQGRKRINLALQGGGSHGALTWGVLDRLLEDGRLQISAISGTSAGAMNAVVLADGYERDGPDGARAALSQFWKAVSDAARFSPIQRSLWDRMSGRYSLDRSPGYLFMESLSRVFSPYDLNPTNVNPLRDILERHVDFDNVNRRRAVQVFVTATNVRTGRPRIFGKGDVTVDSVLASACLPQMFPAVEIGGEHYWDGGFAGNPALYPLIDNRASQDIVVVQINPIDRRKLPRSAREIINRVNEISFNTSLIKELRAIALTQRIADEAGLDLGHRRTFLHIIHTEEEVEDLAASSKLNAEWGYLRMLFERGRGWADAWLAEHFDDIGLRSTLDLDEIFEDAPRPALPTPEEPVDPEEKA
ncbi:patatin-like phospholipase family protein [Amaricoccus sp.]|uniref:patatin-like phospholipase family protein n=1 Tax=Amaricoccus sp. TaxID=1872485 RepID=UPI001B63333B|nr:patatin-like phospholipase family protein [Amaricoccus sp.]MBP7242982.1 patatin-like phospholipase family protein [Amaricoccus sp.]